MPIPEIRPPAGCGQGATPPAAWSGRARALLMGAIVLAAASAVPAPAAASRFFRAEEIGQAYALRARVMDRVPGLAEAVGLGNPSAAAGGDPAELLRGLERLKASEGENPFYHWAEGEVRRRAGDAAAAAAAFARAAAAPKANSLTHWLLWEAYVQRDEFAEAERELVALKEAHLAWGLARFPRLADRLIREARLAAGRGAFAEATLLLERAVDSDPYQASAHFVRAQILWGQSWRNAVPAFGALVTGIRLAAQSSGLRQMILAKVLGDLLAILPMALGVLAAVLVFRCRELLDHDAGHLVRSRLTPGLRAALAGAICLPILLGLGLFWAILLILILLAPYMPARERAVVSALLLILFLLPGAYREVARYQLLAASPRAVLADEVEAGARGDEVLKDVERWAAENPGSFVPRYYVGLLHKRRGELDAGAADLRRAAGIAPAQPAPWVALGNVLYMQGNKDGAMEAYAKAAVPPGNSAAAHLNAGFIYIERFELDRARREIEEGFRLDPRLASAVSAPRFGRPGSFMADERLGASEAQAALVPAHPKPEDLAAANWAGTLRGVPLDALPMVAGGILLAFWGMGRWGRRAAQARPCDRCGAVVCPRCERVREETMSCPACAAAANPREGIPASMKARRLRAAEEFRERRRRLAGILALSFPGAGHLFLGRVLEGMLLVLPALFVLSVLLMENVLAPQLRIPAGMAWALRGVAVAPLLLGLYAVSALHCARLAARKEG